jgi:hypothetical protein
MGIAGKLEIDGGEMTEQEYINTGDLRTWRIISDALRWIQPSDLTRQVRQLVIKETDRLEEIVTTEPQR